MTLEPLTDQDPGDETLFDIDETAPRRCTCGVTRKNLCVYAADVRNGENPGRRPRGCLLRVDPATAPFPPNY